jgi:hypothetical protein
MNHAIGLTIPYKRIIIIIHSHLGEGFVCTHRHLLSPNTIELAKPCPLSSTHKSPKPMQEWSKIPPFFPHPTSPKKQYVLIRTYTCINSENKTRDITKLIKPIFPKPLLNPKPLNHRVPSRLTLPAYIVTTNTPYLPTYPLP